MRNKGLLIPVRVWLWFLIVTIIVACIGWFTSPTGETAIVFVIAAVIMVVSGISLYCLGKFVKANEKKEGN